MTKFMPDEFIDHYEDGQEHLRLTKGHGRFEKARTIALIARFSPPPPAVIYDVGGGTGVYAYGLATMGYDVHPIDATPLHIEQAKALAKDHPKPLDSFRVGDARHINVTGNYADAVLLFGPLYHLTEEQDRVSALAEARRILRLKGTLMAAAIPRFVSTLGALSDGLLDDPVFGPIFQRDLKDGQHRNKSNDSSYFTTAYFHHPDELKTEFNAAKLTHLTTLAVEGPARLVPDLEACWQEQKLKDWLLGIIEILESEPTLLGLSTHLMAIGKLT